jgi:hypothetical protein
MLIGVTLAETAETPANQVIRKRIISLQVPLYAGTCSFGTQLRASPA